MPWNHRRHIALVGAAALLAACSERSLAPTAASPSDVNASRADVSRMDPITGHEAHLFYARGQARKSSSPDMTWHGGGIMQTAATASIFWGTSWSNSAFASDKINGMDSFYGGFGRSNYAATSNEYTDASGAVTSSVSYLGHFMDPSASLNHPPQVSDIVTEVCSVLTSNGVTPVPNGFYMVYTDRGRGGQQYCAWHSYGSCGGVQIQVAFAFNLDGDAGCDPGDTQTGHSQGLAAIANVSAHELSEARTDPELNAWYDASGAENGDKCAWTFNVPFVTFSNRSIWKLQGEWSNAAFDSQTGYPNRDGQNGCLSGK